MQCVSVGAGEAPGPGSCTASCRRIRHGIELQPSCACELTGTMLSAYGGRQRIGNHHRLSKRVGGRKVTRAFGRCGTRPELVSASRFRVHAYATKNVDHAAAHVDIQRTTEVNNPDKRLTRFRRFEPAEGIRAAHRVRSCHR